MVMSKGKSIVKKAIIYIIFFLFAIVFFLTPSSLGGEDSYKDAELHQYTDSYTANDVEVLENIDVVEKNESNDQIEYKDHVFDSWNTVKDPTCAEMGVKVRICTVCMYQETEKIPFTTHTERRIDAIAPTCTHFGKTEGVMCVFCRTLLDGCEQILPTGHEYLPLAVVSPTCTSEGYTLYSCSCGNSYKDDYVSMVEHSHDHKEIVSPTCTENGYTLYKCQCGDSYKDDEVSASGHYYEEKIVSPTCVSEGYTLHKCKYCEESYKDNYTSQGKHSYKGKVVLPTILDKGYTIYTCENCGTSYKDNYTDYNSLVENAYAGNSKVLAQGIDVSRWNHEKDSDGNYLSLDWQAIKDSGIDFVILKAGSTVGKDPVFEMDYKAAKAVGLDVGAYYYVYAMTPDEAVTDAKMFLEFIKGKKFEYPLYMDFEDDSQRYISASTKTKMIENFIVTLQRSGYYAGLYTGYYWMTPRFNILETDKIVDMIDIWFAHVDSKTAVSVDTVYVWSSEKNLGHSEFGMWQYSHSGVFSEIKDENFDFNYAYKDYPSIIKKLGLNGYTAESTTVTPDDKTEYVWVKVAKLNVRSYWDISTSDNILGVANKGDKFEIVEKTSEYVKIKYKDSVAYISANTGYVSFSPV